MLAFLPQFVDPARGPVWAQMLILGSLLNVGGILVNATVASLIGLGASSTRLQRTMNVVSGTLLGGLAGRLALVEQ